MLDRLPESRRTASRPLAQFVVAAAVHAALAAAALRAAAAPPPAPGKRIDTLIIEHFAPRPSTPARAGRAAGASAVAAPAPVLSAFPVLPPITTPDGIATAVDSAPGGFRPSLPGGRIDLGELLGPARPSAGILDEADAGVDAPRLLAAETSPLEGSGARGVVGLQFVVDTAGRVEAGSVTVTEAPDSTLAAAAIAIVRGARFQPGRAAGRPVRIRVRQNVTFDP